MTNDKYTGKCFRHLVRFIPSEQFDNNCPACYCESKRAQAARQAGGRDNPGRITELKRNVRDKNVRIVNLGGGSFMLMDDPEERR